MPQQRPQPLSELIGQLEKRGERLPHEIGAFVALEACESLLRQPARVAADQLWVDERGAVSVAPSSVPAGESESAADLVRVLDDLLEAAGAGVPPSLLSITEESAGAEGLEPLRERLIRALMPLNRAASRRVLARMVREAERAALGERALTTGPEQTLEEELDELIDSGLRESGEVPVEVAPPEHSDIQELSTSAATKVRRSKRRAKSSWVEWRPGRRSLIATIALAVLGLGALGITQGWIPRFNYPTSDVEASLPQGTLHIEATPLDAQAFLYLGRSPIFVEDLDVGSLHEFVAFDEGTTVSRAIIAPSATWQESPEGPLYELALQTRTLEQGEALSFGEPSYFAPPEGAAAAQEAQRGRVRIITTPAGAKVYRYLGRGQRLSVENMRRDLGHEVLFVHPETSIERAVVAPSDWHAEGDTQSATLRVRLTPKTPPAKTVIK